MNKGRFIFFVFILLAGIGLIILLLVNNAQPPVRSTLAPAFQLLGKPVNSMNRALTRVIIADSLSEQEYGDAIALRYEHLKERNIQEHAYLQELIDHLVEYTQKGLKYRIFVLDYTEPNAFALPGGGIIVTSSLLQTMATEGQLASILAHEMGHIERGHCLQAVRFQLLTKKIGHRQLGQLADFAVNTLLQHTYSKTQEDEADEYAYYMILNTQYDPYSIGGSFDQLSKYEGTGRQDRSKAHILRDYFMTHPPLLLRSEKFRQWAKQWWIENPNAKRYRGAANLQNRTTYYTYCDYPGEWSVASD